MRALSPAALLLLSCATSASSASPGGPGDLAVQGSYRHTSGLEFPEHVAGITRGGLRRFDGQNQDVSASYTCHDGHHPLVATVYLYPGPAAERMSSPREAVAAALAHFEAVKHEVARAHSGTKLVSEEQFPMIVKGAEYPALRATMDFDDEWGGAMTPLRSYVYVVPFVGGRWVVKYRFTHPRDTVSASEPEVKAFLAAWPGAR
jgi:hypothetical protein